MLEECYFCGRQYCQQPLRVSLASRGVVKFVVHCTAFASVARVFVEQVAVVALSFDRASDLVFNLEHIKRLLLGAWDASPTF